jgi:glycosyltransferase involved in cell wall biosynthesis
MLCSIVIPVYNEAENICAVLTSLSKALADEPHEILVVYDFDEDTTLEAVRSMPDCPSSVRLVKNDFGTGVINALKKGFAAADGDAVVTMMADQSDNPQDIPAMLEKCRSGAAVVAGSRYMKGGKQIGGPALKRFLSRAAGLSLYYLAGLKTHDATSNFRAYRTDFLRSTTVESKQGFEVALELTVKAHNAGLRIDEVPTVWQDRTAGESRFRLLKWLPAYLRWYFAAAAVPLLVFLLPLFLYCNAVEWIRWNAFPIPILESSGNIPKVCGEEPITLSWLWSQFTEHRLFFPRLFYLAAAIPTHCRETHICIANTLWFLLAVFIVLLGMRQIRGRTSLFDLFIPLLLLTPTMAADNWRHSWDGCNTIPISLLIIGGTLLFNWTEKPSWYRLSAFCICLILLPLCGIGHVLTGGCLALGGIYLCGYYFRNGVRLKNKTQAFFLFACSCYALFMFPFYFVNYVHPPIRAESLGIFPALLSSVFLFGSGLLGPSFSVNPATCVLLLILLSVLIAGLGIAVYNCFHNRYYGELFPLLAAGMLIGCIGWGRNAEGLLNITAPRLTSFAMPLYVFLFMTYEKYTSRSIKQKAFILLFSILLYGIYCSTSIAYKDGYYLTRDKTVTNLWTSRLADVLYNVPLYPTQASMPVVPSDTMEMVIKHRLGVLRIIKPLYTFDDLPLIEKFSGIAPSYEYFNADILSEDANGVKIKAVNGSAAVLFRGISIPAHHTPVVRFLIEETKTGKTNPVYVLQEYPVDLDKEININFTAEFLKPLLRLHIWTGHNKEIPKDKAARQKIFLRGNMRFDPQITVPGEFIIRSIEIRALPVYKE